MTDPAANHSAIIDGLHQIFQRRDAGSTVGAFERLTAGASRETYRFEVSTADGVETYVLQRERSGVQRNERGMAAEGSVVRAAADAGMPVPELIATNESDPADSLGPSWFISRAVAGESLARRIQRDDEYAGARETFARDAGAALGRLHSIPTDALNSPDLSHLEQVDEVSKWRDVVDELDLTSPSFELALRWLETHRPQQARAALVHGDFRLGNLLVDQGGLTAVLDWELAHIGDPLEDLGWLCVRAWRFGGPEPVAGIGAYDDLLAAHEAATGVPVDREAFAWWELLGTLKWGIMCGLQAEAHRSGVVDSLEMLAIGNRIAEQEYDVTWAIAAQAGAQLDASTIESFGLDKPASAGSGQPRVDELCGALASFLRGSVQPALSGGLAFHTRVAANVVGMLEREGRAGVQQRERHATRLGEFGVADDAALASALRSGSLDNRLAEVATLLAHSTAERLAVVNPKWLA